MTLIGDFIPSFNSGNASKAMLDLTYRHSVILLSDVASMGLAAAGISNPIASAIADLIPVPLLGFVYETPSQVELLKYRYSEYPYLNKSLIVNSYIRENTRFSVRAHRLITASNPVPINIAANELYFQLIQEYCNRGGTFTLATMWGIYDNCVLEELIGIPPEASNGVAGTGFEFRFLRLHFSGNSLIKKIANGVKSLAQGVL